MLKLPMYLQIHIKRSNMFRITQFNKIFITLFLLLVLCFGAILYITTSVASPFQKIFLNSTKNNGFTPGNNYYLELLLQPDVRYPSEVILKNINVSPQVSFEAKLKDGTILLDFTSQLSANKTYTVSFNQGTGIKQLDRFKYSFTTEKIKLLYIKNANTKLSTIAQKTVGETSQILISKPNIISFFKTADYIVYSYQEQASFELPVMYEAYNIQTKQIRQIPGLYDTFSKSITESLSNQIILRKSTSEFILMQLDELKEIPLQQADNIYTSILGFLSQDSVLINDMSRNSEIYNLQTGEKYLIGKYSKLLGVDYTTGHICLNGQLLSNKVDLYNINGENRSLEISQKNVFNVFSNDKCSKFVTLISEPNNFSGYRIEYFDVQKNETEQIALENVDSTADIVLDNAGDIIGYTKILDNKSNEFIIYDRNNKKIVDSIPDVANIIMYI